MSVMERGDFAIDAWEATDKQPKESAVTHEELRSLVDMVDQYFTTFYTQMYTLSLRVCELEKKIENKRDR